MLQFCLQYRNQVVLGVQLGNHNLVLPVISAIQVYMNKLQQHLERGPIVGLVHWTIIPIFHGGETQTTHGKHVNWFSKMQL